MQGGNCYNIFRGWLAQRLERFVHIEEVDGPNPSPPTVCDS